MKLFALRTFLFKQRDLEGGHKEDVIAQKGKPIEVSEKEAIRFWGDFTDSDKGAPMSDKLRSKLLTLAKNQGLTRVV